MPKCTVQPESQDYLKSCKQTTAKNKSASQWTNPWLGSLSFLSLFFFNEKKEFQNNLAFIEVYSWTPIDFNEAGMHSENEYAMNNCGQYVWRCFESV